MAKKEKAPSLAVVRMLCTMIDQNVTVHAHSHWGASARTTYSYKHPADKLSLHTSTAEAANNAGYIEYDPSSVGRRGLVYRVTEAGKEFAEKHRHLIAEPETVTYIVVGHKVNSWGVQNFVGPLCKVIRETDKRAYVEVVRWGTGDGKVDSCYSIHGRAPNQYVDAADILYRNVTEAQYIKLFNAGAEYTAWKKGVEKAEKDEIEDTLAPIRKRYADRRDQKLAQFEDEVREIMEKRASGE